MLTGLLAASESDRGVVVAVVTAAVAVVVAAFTQLTTWMIDHRHRVYDRRRTALLDLQDAALAVRSRLRENADQLLAAVRTLLPSDHVQVDEDRGAVTRQSDAEALLELRLARIESDAVRDDTLRWQRTAHFAFMNDDETTEADELAAWRGLNATIGVELTVPGWWGSLRLRRMRRAARRSAAGPARPAGRPSDRGSR